MARFDVYRRSRAGDHLLDCQADAIGQLNTRLVVPLLEPSEGPPPIARLNPSFRLGEIQLVMYTQFASAMPVGELARASARLRTSTTGS